MGIAERLQQRSRDSKYSLFEEVFKPGPETRILDVGSGGAYKGECFLEERYSYHENLTVVDVNPKSMKVTRERFPKLKACITADACCLPFADKSFDIVFSNAVIEHVGNWERQKQFASEMMRVADRWYITTPNKFFPVELHYLVPFFQFVPKGLQKALCERMSVGLCKKGDWMDIDLLSIRQMKKLFPGSKVATQRIGGLVSTFVVYKE